MTFNEEEALTEAVNKGQDSFMGRNINIAKALSKEEYQKMMEEKMEDPEFRENFEKRQTEKLSRLRSQVYIRNLNFNASEEDVAELLSSCGDIVSIVIPEVDNMVQFFKQKRGYCYVRFANEEAAQNAIDKSGSPIMGRQVEISMVQEKKKFNQ